MKLKFEDRKPGSGRTASGIPLVFLALTLLAAPAPRAQNLSATMTTSRYGLTATLLLNLQILLTGGYTGYPYDSTSAELYELGGQ